MEIEYVLGEYEDTPEGNLMKNVRAVVAEYERLRITERMERGKRLLVESGRVLLHGNQPPYGYRRTEDRTLEVYEPEARIVRLMFKWYTEGDGTGERLGTGAIAEKLTQMGIPTWVDTHRRGHKKQGYGQWSEGTVLGILKRRTYLGRWYYGKRSRTSGRWIQRPYDELQSVEVPAIISQEVWDQMEKQKEINKVEARRNVKHDYLLAKRLTCGMSGHTVYSRFVQTPKKAYQYYQCAAKVGKIVEEDCDLPSFRVERVDAAVWEWVKTFLTDPTALAAGLDAQHEERERANKPLRQRLSVVDDLLSEHRQKMKKLLELYLEGDFSGEILSERKADLEAALAGLERERASLVAQLETRALTSDQIKTIEEFAAEVSKGLEQADRDFTARWRVIEILDVRGQLAVEDGEQVVYARCVIGDSALSIDNNNSYAIMG